MTQSLQFDIAIIGAGPAGLFALRQVLKNSPEKRILLLELGRPPGKRRRQIEGWFGAVPFGDGKFWKKDSEKVYKRIKNENVNSLFEYYWQYFSSLSKNKFSKDNLPSQKIQKELKDLGFLVSSDVYLQWKPNNFHELSHLIVSELKESKNLKTIYDTEVLKVEKNNSEFIIKTLEERFSAKNVLIATGRSGWRWSSDLVKEMEIKNKNTKANFGVFLEFPAQHLKDFNHSSCILEKENFTIGPFSWGGTIIPEDHADLIISAFRSNESRWETEKVAFSINQVLNVSDGIKETERLGKLALLLFNDRVSREKIRIFLRKESQLSLLPEFSSLLNIFSDLEKIIPDFGSRGYLHAPYVKTIVPEFELDQNCQSEIPGLYFAGESAGVHGILSAVLMGHLAGEGLSK